MIKERASYVLRSGTIHSTREQRSNAHWIDNKFLSNIKTCSNCYKDASVDSETFDYLFCPYCGARMNEKEGG